MGVTYDIRCVDCRCVAPDVGDGGFLGCPSIHEDEEDSLGPSFGYYYIPLSGLSICPMDLQRFCEWLFAHSEHEVHVAGDLPTPPHLPPGALYWDDEANDSAETGFLVDPSRDGYIWGRYEIRCLSCRVAYSASEPEWMWPFEGSLIHGSVIEDESVRTFLERWDSGEEVACYRLRGVADPKGAFMPGFVQFLRTHAPPPPPARRFSDHALEARIVQVQRDQGAG